MLRAKYSTIVTLSGLSNSFQINRKNVSVLVILKILLKRQNNFAKQITTSARIKRNLSIRKAGLFHERQKNDMSLKNANHINKFATFFLK